MFNKKAEEGRGEMGTKVQETEERRKKRNGEEREKKGDKNQMRTKHLPMSGLYNVPLHLHHSFSPNNNPLRCILLTTFYR